MNTYRYHVKRPNGQTLVGVLKAESQVLAAQQARELGGTILELARVADEEAPAKKGSWP